MMKKHRTLTIILLTVLLMLSSCSKRPEFLVRSPSVGTGISYDNVILVYSETAEFDITSSKTVKLTFGICGTSKRSMHIGESVILEMTAEGGLVFGESSAYKKEYKDFYEDDKYYPDITEDFFGQTVKTPNYYEEVEITVPEGNCYGRIIFNLWNPYDESLDDEARLQFFYASNGSVLLIDNRAMFGVDEDGEAIRTH